MTSASLVLHFHGPLQSWGTDDRFNIRGTERLPTKSGVIGLLAAADGRPRRSDVSDLTQLTLTVRVDRPGRTLRDYHTVGAAHPKGKRLISAEGKERADAILTERYYLADAAFTIALFGDGALLSRLDDALRAPRWPLALGRRSCPPAEPFVVGLRHADPMTVLRDQLPVIRDPQNGGRSVRFVTDHVAGEERSARDQPGTMLGAWSSYTSRSITIIDIELAEDRFTIDAFELLEPVGVER